MSNHKGCHCNRRTFLASSGATVSALSLGKFAYSKELQKIKPCGPASEYIPKIHAAFVRRKEEYGMWWPGAVYDGEAARIRYTEDVRKAEKELGLQIDLRPEPIYSEDEAKAWIKQAEKENADGLLVLMLDRQQHSWPTATMAIDSPIPAIIFSPLGSSFTTNTIKVANKPGVFISCADRFDQAAFGLKMIKAGAKLRETRYVVIQGNEKRDAEISHYGTKLRYVPASSFLQEYRELPVSDEAKAIAAEYLKYATHKTGATEQDVINGVKSYLVARNILEREEGDAITMDCLGALGNSEVSLPCISWSRMLDHGIPAACEADLDACVTHALVQYLFDRPGFQQDPVADTMYEALIGAHCTCPTKLRGFEHDPELYSLMHHHGNRDAVPHPVWEVGQRVTVAIANLPRGNNKANMIVSAGEVMQNIEVPPAGGCVVSVMVKLDGIDDLLDYPGFHQLFFYGDYKKELESYCQLYDIEPRIL